MYIYCVVCYCVIVAPHVRSVGHVFAYIYTLNDDLEYPMDYETSLLPKDFPPYVYHGQPIYIQALLSYVSHGQPIYIQTLFSYVSYG